MKKQILGFICAVSVFPIMVFAQKNDSAAKIHAPNCKNIIKFNPTPMIL
jgi:hypothetical protein